MKNSSISIAIYTVALLAAGVGCASSPEKKAEKVEVAKANLVQAKLDLKQAITDSLNDYQVFKGQVQAKLVQNEIMMAELKVQLQDEKLEIRQYYASQLVDLQKRNALFKIRLAENKQTATDKWAAFKLSFNKELDELRQSISVLAEKNMAKVEK